MYTATPLERILAVWTAVHLLNYKVILCLLSEKWEWELPSCVQLFVIPWTIQSMEFYALEWVAFPFSRASSQPRDWTQVSRIAADSLPAEPQGKPLLSEDPTKFKQECLSEVTHREFFRCFFFVVVCLFLLRHVLPTQDDTVVFKHVRWPLKHVALTEETDGQKFS